MCPMTGEEDGKERRMCEHVCMCGVDGGRSQFPGEPGQTLIFSPWQLPESFSRRAISLSYYNASLKHNPLCLEIGEKEGLEW